MTIEITREQFFNFIKKDNESLNGEISSFTQHYLDYFDTYQATGKKAGRNWAGLLQPLSLIYRRMIINALLIDTFINIVSGLDKFASLIVLFSGVQLSEDFTLILDITSVVLAVLSYCVLICYGDYMYLLHVNKKVRAGDNRGGTRLRNIWYTLAIMLLLFAAMMFWN